MTAIFDHAWTSKFPQALQGLAKDEWAMGLAEFDGNTIKMVLDYLRTASNEKGFAPNLSQFIALCRMYKGSRFIEPVAPKQIESDEEIERRYELGDQALTEIFQKLGLKRKRECDEERK